MPCPRCLREKAIPAPGSGVLHVVAVVGEDLAALVGALLGGLDLLVALALAVVHALAGVVGAGALALALAGVDAGALHHRAGLLGGLALRHGAAGEEHGGDGGGDGCVPDVHGLSL